MKRIQEWIKERKDANNDGFSLVELVVAIGVLAVLSSTGLVSYSIITNNAHKEATNAAASEVYLAVIAAEHDGNSNTTPKKVVDDYNKVRSQDTKIKVVLISSSDTKQVGITATNSDVKPVYSVTRGAQNK